MRTITKNKIRKGTLCYRCGKNEVPLGKWNRPCSECKKKVKKSKDLGVEIGRKVPAAVITTADGRRVFTDKFGDIVEDHDYDLDNDPRGWKATGKLKERVII